MAIEGGDNLGSEEIVDDDAKKHYSGGPDWRISAFTIVQNIASK